MTSVLLVEDEDDLRSLVHTSLAREGFDVVAVPNLTAARKVETSPTVAILDRMLPEGDGLQLAEELRAKCDARILVLSARSSEQDRIDGFERGADDYMVKPFSVRELVHRVKVLAQAAADRASIRDLEDPEVYQWRDLTLDVTTRTVSIGKKKIPLRPMEQKLLHYLFMNRTRIVDGVEITEHLGLRSPRIAVVHMSRLRQALGEAHAPLVETVVGVGYRIRKE